MKKHLLATGLHAIRKFFRNIRGAILIEFAVGIPLLLMLLFGMCDIFKMTQMQDKTNFCAHLIVQMIQNISQNRKDKKITLNDLADICRFVGYVTYPGTTQYSVVDRRHIYGHFPFTHFYCVKGLSGGKASVIWLCYYRPITVSANFDKALKGSSIACVVNDKKSVDPSKIYPTLKINEGEIKILVVNFIYCYRSLDRYADGSRIKSVKELFRLYLLYPPSLPSPREEGRSFFHSVAIFTPRLGLFDEEGPK